MLQINTTGELHPGVCAQHLVPFQSRLAFMTRLAGLDQLSIAYCVSLTSNFGFQQSQYVHMHVYTSRFSQTEAKNIYRSQVNLLGCQYFIYLKKENEYFKIKWQKLKWQLNWTPDHFWNKSYWGQKRDIKIDGNGQPLILVFLSRFVSIVPLWKAPLTDICLMEQRKKTM